MLITKAEAARILGISEPAIQKWKDKSFFTHSGAKIMIDTDNPEWINELNKPRRLQKNKSISDGAIKHDRIKNAFNNSDDEDEERPRHYVPPVMSDEVKDLTQRAAIAEMEKTIFESKIKEEKSKQEEIKTLELKRDLAPMYLVKHFFSFAENLIQRAYRRYNELSPELEALYLAGKREQAVKFLLREQESITKDAVDKLIKAIKEEGYRVESLD